MSQSCGSNREGFNLVQSAGKQPVRLDGLFNIVSYDLVTKLSQAIGEASFKASHQYCSRLVPSQLEVLEIWFAQDCLTKEFVMCFLLWSTSSLAAEKLRLLTFTAVGCCYFNLVRGLATGT